MKKFKIPSLCAITFLSLIFLAYYVFLKPQRITSDSPFPYLEMELCIDGESGHILKKYSHAENQKSAVRQAITAGIRKCDLAINDLVNIIAHKTRENNAVKEEHKIVLKQRIQTAVLEKYTSQYLDDFKKIVEIANWKNSDKKANDMLQTLERKKELNSFVEEKIQENDKNLNDMIQFLNTLISTEET